MTVSWRPSTRADGMRKYTRDVGEQRPYCLTALLSYHYNVKQTQMLHITGHEIFTFYILREMCMKIQGSNIIKFFYTFTSSMQVMLLHKVIVIPDIVSI